MIYLTPYDLSWAVRKIPAALQKIMKERPGTVCVAGGFVRASVANEPINDIDVFCSSKEEAQQVKMTLLRLAGTKVGKVVQTENAITLTHFHLPIQIITRWTFTCSREVCDSFDFTCCRAAIFFSKKTNAWASMCDERFYPDLAARRLTYCNPDREEDAGGSALRVLKYYQRGYRIPLDSYAKIIARLVAGCTPTGAGKVGCIENQIQDRLREVDPSVDPDHTAHLPATAEPVNTDIANLPAELSPRGNSGGMNQLV